MRLCRRSPLGRPGIAVGMLLAFIAACPDGPPDEGDAGATAGNCAAFCALEADCDLRTMDACETSSCDGDDRKPSDSDACIADAETCADVVLCTCAESCAKVDLCTGSDDPTCPATCETLSMQNPAEKYRENRCVIESDCLDLALCTGGAG